VFCITIEVRKLAILSLSTSVNGQTAQVITNILMYSIHTKVIIRQGYTHIM